MKLDAKYSKYQWEQRSSKRHVHSAATISVLFVDFLVFENVVSFFYLRIDYGTVSVLSTICYNCGTF